MQVNLIYIEKKDAEFEKLSQKYLSLIAHFARVKEYNLNNHKISKAVKLGKTEALRAYEEAFAPYKKNFCVILDESGQSLTSLELATLLKDKSELSFFIGGAYGLDKTYIKSFDFVLSLSTLTFAHSLAKLVLLEQIYRAFCIQKNHPYHK